MIMQEKERIDSGIYHFAPFLRFCGPAHGAESVGGGLCPFHNPDLLFCQPVKGAENDPATGREDPSSPGKIKFSFVKH
jgi:hypothetical protein